MARSTPSQHGVQSVLRASSIRATCWNVQIEKIVRADSTQSQLNPNTVDLKSPNVHFGGHLGFFENARGECFWNSWKLNCLCLIGILKNFQLAWTFFDPKTLYAYTILPAVNLINQPATQSQTLANNSAAYALDGWTNGIYAYCSLANNLDPLEPAWWQVDLGQTYRIFAVSIYTTPGGWLMALTTLYWRSTLNRLC